MFVGVVSLLRAEASAVPAGSPPQSAVEAPGAAVASASGEPIAGVTLVRGESPGLYPELLVVQAQPALVDDGTVYRLTLPYAQELIDRWHVPAREMGVFRMAGDTWRWTPVAIDAAARTTTIDVSGGTAWAVGPSWMMKPWQQRRIVGADLRTGERNALILHGWNGEPWEQCTIQLAAGIGSAYDNVASVAYPSALDIAGNGAWLRNEIEARYDGVPLDIIAFSEGGLVARAAIEPQDWNGGDEIAADIRRLVTIATPHEGLEPDAPLSLTDDVAAKQMRAGSDLLRELNDGPQAAGVRYELIGGDRSAATDGVVPLESALALDSLSAASRTVVQLAHTPSNVVAGMPCDDAVYEAIVAD